MDSDSLFRIEIFDCPESGFSIHWSRASANERRNRLAENPVNAANIRIVKIDAEGVPPILPTLSVCQRRIEGG
jgi:hypothetical protein